MLLHVLYVFILFIYIYIYIIFFVFFVFFFFCIVQDVYAIVNSSVEGKQSDSP